MHRIPADNGVMELLERFLLGGLIVSAFAMLGDVLRPKGFAGLFGAAPSVALATLSLTVCTEGKSYAAVEARSMIAGALAFLVYTLACIYFMARKHYRAAPTTLVMLGLWGACAWGLWSIFLK
jgi:uncharacterized membrane protein (GlpM family)